MWPSLIKKAKEGGLDVIETYVFWNAHEPLRRQVFYFNEKLLVPYYIFWFFVFCTDFIFFFFLLYMQYDFSGNLDLVRFIKTIQNEGLHAMLRIGPYVCAEWNYG